MKKAISAATSAALLASLLATAVAPSALASISQTSAGNVAQGTTSAGTATFLFTENSINALNTTGTMTVTITPAAPGAGSVTWAGTPVLVAPDSLGASVSLAGNVMTIKVTGHDDANVETISITGLKVKASATASPGAVVATLSAGMIADAFRTSTATAIGKLSQAYGPLTTHWIVAVDAGSPCIFGGTNAVTVGSETLAVTFVSANNVPVVGQQTFDTAAMTNNHLANEVVTQTVNNCNPNALPGSPATVVRAAAYSSDGNPTVYPGENNSHAADLFVEEPVAGFLAKGTTLTFTINTAGVVFSKAPTATASTGLTAIPATTVVTGVTATVLTATGTLAAGTYCYEVTALTALGATTPTTAQCATSASGAASVALTWTAVAGATGYNVYGRPATSGGTFLKVNAAPIAITSFVDNGSLVPAGGAPGANNAFIAVPAAPVAAASTTGGTLAIAGDYSYKITAVTAAGETSASAASNIVATTSSTSSISLSWTAVAGATGYNVYGRAGASYLKMNTSPIAGTSFVDNGSLVPAGAAPANNAAILVPTGLAAVASSTGGTLVNGTAYFYVVTALNGAGETLKSAEATATATASGAITVAWTALVGATAYNIYRGTVTGGPYGLIGTATGNATVSFLDTGFTASSATPPTVSTANTTGVLTLGSLGSCVLSSTRTSCTVTISAASTGPSTITLDDIFYDVAASVPGGTFVEVGLALSGGLLTDVATNTNAVVFRGITATAPMPTVYIGENNQATGLVTLTELAAGFFQSGTGNNNVLAVCTTAVDYSFTFAPWAKVVGGTAAGNLIFRDGTTASTTNIVAGTWDGGNCYTWTVWTASTTASTIVIGDSTFATGPLINVQTDQAPGIVAMKIYSGNGTTYTSGQIATVGFAIAAFRNQVAVTALSQPLIPAGAKSKAGAIQIAETANGQLKRWESLCFEILPRASNEMIQDTFMQALTTADLPVVTATGGLIVGPVELFDESCLNRELQDGSALPIITGSGTHAISFSFDVFQQSTAGNGKLVVDNINLITTADAPNGPVLFNVYGFGGSPTNLEFQATVSNAIIGVAPKLNLRKVVVNDNGGTATVADFTLKADSTTGSNDLSGTSPVGSAGLLADTWALSETGPAGYAASDWVCVGGTQNGSNITVANGGEATCTITNNDIPPKLHLRKVVINDNGRTATVANFTLKADSTTGSNDLSGTSPVDSGAGLLADTWALSETGPAGYAASNWVCVGGTQSGSLITVAIGGEATCTTTNNDKATLNIGAYSALGLRPTSGYTTKTPKTQAIGKYVTWKFKGGTALANQRVNVMVAKKVGGVWGVPMYFVSRWADANGIVTFWWKANTAAAINVRVQWPGSATYGVSTSKARGAYWK
jgi:hypothetical protein